MKPFSLYLLLVSVICFSSCKVQEDIQFKKDLSGTMSYTLDLSMMRTLSAQMGNMKMEGDSLGKEKAPSDINDMFKGLDSIAKSPKLGELSEIPGLSNIKAQMIADKFNVSFDFKDLNALNKAYTLINSQSDPAKMANGGGFTPGEAPSEKAIDVNTMPVYSYFKSKGSELIYSRPNKKAGEGDKNSISNMGGAEMNNMFEHNIHISFDKKVKSMKAKNITATQDGNDINIKSTLQDLMKEGTELKIKLK